MASSGKYASSASHSSTSPVASHRYSSEEFHSATPTNTASDPLQFLHSPPESLDSATPTNTGSDPLRFLRHPDQVRRLQIVLSHVPEFEEFIQMRTGPNRRTAYDAGSSNNSLPTKRARVEIPYRDQQQLQPRPQPEMQPEDDPGDGAPERQANDHRLLQWRLLIVEICFTAIGIAVQAFQTPNPKVTFQFRCFRKAMVFSFAALLMSVYTYRYSETVAIIFEHIAVFLGVMAFLLAMTMDQ